MKESGNRVEVGIIAVVFAVALGASLAFLHAFPLPAMKNDAVLYYRIAQNVSAGNGFAVDGRPVAVVPPLFSSLLGAWFRLTGESIMSAAFFQCLVHALSSAAAYLLFRAMPCGRRLSLFLALVVALHPLLLTRVAFILQEPTILLFTTTALLASVIWFRRQTDLWACAAGLFWGIATLAKAVTFFVLPLAFVSRLAWGRDGRRIGLRQAVLFVLLFLAVLAPWTARNYVRFHRWIPVSDQGPGHAVYDWFASGARTKGNVAGDTDAAVPNRGGGSWDHRIVSFLQKSDAYLGNFPVGRVARQAIDFTGPARDWWWERGRYGPGDPREWYWVVHDVFHRALFLLLPVFVFRTAHGKLPAPRGFVALFCFLYWIVYSLLLGIPRYSVPIYPALLALLIPSGTKASAGRNEGFHFRSYTFRMGGRP